VTGVRQVKSRQAQAAATRNTYLVPASSAAGSGGSVTGARQVKSRQAQAAATSKDLFGAG